MMDRGEAYERQYALVEHLKATGLIQSPSVEDAFRSVPRHLFLPNEPLDRAYADEAIPTKRQHGVPISSSSQPSMMAIMLEQLALEPGLRVLEIGAGTGYNAALMAHIVGESGQVISVDIDQDIIEDAQRHLLSAGFPNVRLLVADGAQGYPEFAPYDRIVLTVAASDLSPAWAEQLLPSGRLLLPLHLKAGIQKVTAFQHANDHLESVSIRGGSFMPLRGQSAWVRENALHLGSGIAVTLDSETQPNAEALLQLLSGSSQTSGTGVQVTVREVLDGLDLWLAVRDPDICLLHSMSTADDPAPLPWLVGEPGKFRLTFGLLAGSGLALLAPLVGGARPREFELGVRSYGSASPLARRLASWVQSWSEAKHPSTQRLRIRAYWKDPPGRLAEGEIPLRNPNSTLVLDWPE